MLIKDLLRKINHKIGFKILLFPQIYGNNFMEEKRKTIKIKDAASVYFQ